MGFVWELSVKRLWAGFADAFLSDYTCFVLWGIGWRAEVLPRTHPVNELEFDVIIGADGRRNTLPGKSTCTHWEQHTRYAVFFFIWLYRTKHKQHYLFILSSFGMKSEHLWPHSYSCGRVHDLTLFLTYEWMTICACHFMCVFVWVWLLRPNSFWWHSLWNRNCWNGCLLRPHTQSHWLGEPLWRRVPWPLSVLLTAAWMKGSSRLPLGKPWTTSHSFNTKKLFML